MEKQYSKEFSDIIKGYIEGVDYIVIKEKEPRVWHDGEPDGNYDMDFTQMEISARSQNANVVVGRNGGLYGAFDPETHTMILTARPDMIDVESYKDKGLYIPFSHQTHEPADPMKAAALNYQFEIAKRQQDYSYGQHYGLFDHSDEVAFLKAVFPMLKTDADRAKVNMLIAQNARYTATAKGNGKSRNDEHAPMSMGQKFIISQREALDKKEIQTLALEHLKWEQSLGK